MEFSDLTSEEYRQYDFANGHVVRIEAPQKLNISDTGGHRVLDGAGISHYIPRGWFHLHWKVRDGAPAFSF